MDSKSPCQHCGQNLSFPENMIGDLVVCPHCNRETMLGVLSSVPPVAPPMWRPPPVGHPSAGSVAPPAPAPPATNPNLTDCPDCGNSISIRAAACPHCGAPLKAQTQPSPLPQPPLSGLTPSPGRTSFAHVCPKCQSENTVRCALAYASGSSTGVFGALTLDGGGNLGSVGGSSMNQTLLARNVAPLKEDSVGCLWVLVAPGVLLILLGVAVTPNSEMGLIPLIGGFALCGIPMAKSSQIENKKPEFERDLERWQDSWICLRCGKIYLPKPSTTSTPPSSPPWNPGP